MKAVRTTCPYCGVGCGVAATLTGERTVEIKGDADHPANRGRLCSKGTHLGETVGLEGRLLHPMIGDRRVSWDKALDLVRRRSPIRSPRTGRTASPSTSRAAADRGLLCRQQADEGLHRLVEYRHQFAALHGERGRGHVRAFGEDVVPASTRIWTADLIVLVGSNTAWCHPIVYQRILAARASGARSWS
jgi:assimilatory nitrate reductase catalytic subunit